MITYSIMLHRSLILIVASGIGLISSSIFAQNTGSCSACNNTPNTIQSYYEFVTQAIGIIGDDYNESSVSPGAPFVGQFITRNVTLKNSNTLATIFKNQQTRLNENLTFITNTARVLSKTSLGTLDNWTRSMASWFNTTLKRDIDKIASLDPLIDNTTLALGRAGLTDDKLNQASYNELIQLINNYSPTIFDKHSVNQTDTTYGNIITILNHMQAQIKNALINTKNEKVINNKKLQGGNTYIYFSNEAKTTITSAYTCVREQQCNRNAQQAKEAFDDVRQQSIGGSKDAINDFVFGWKRLKKFFSRGVDSLTEEEKKAIEAREAEINRMLNGYRGNSGGVKILNPTFRSNLIDILTDIDEYRSQQSQLTAQTIDDTYIPPISTLEEQMAQGINTINEIIIKDSIALNTMFAHDQTTTIAESIKTLHNTMTILEECENNLSITCTLQCGNKGGTCRAD